MSQKLMVLPESEWFPSFLRFSAIISASRRRGKKPAWEWDPTEEITFHMALKTLDYFLTPSALTTAALKIDTCPSPDTGQF